MRLLRSEQFESERREFRLAFTCEDCAYFDLRRLVCRHGYPTDEHRAGFYEARPPELVFCKEFEL
jgi:hypothetical protein